MKLQFEQPLAETIQYFLKRAGYKEIFDRRSNKHSWIRQLNRSGRYPRFHLYIVNETPGSQAIDIHFDALRPLHRTEASTSENSGPVLDQEVERIKGLATGSLPSIQSSEVKQPKKEVKKKSWFEKIFG
jgi:hypothetical protein